jgi:hypothetical protein
MVIGWNWFQRLDGMWFDSERGLHCITEPTNTSAKRNYLYENLKQDERYLVWDKDQEYILEELYYQDTMQPSEIEKATKGSDETFDFFGLDIPKPDLKFEVKAGTVLMILGTIYMLKTIKKT